jgi:hypothetical protein
MEKHGHPGAMFLNESSSNGGNRGIGCALSLLPDAPEKVAVVKTALSSTSN